MLYLYRNTSQDWLIQLLKNKKIRHKSFISLSSEEDSGGNDHYGNVRIIFDRDEIFKQGAIEIFYDTEFFENYPKICQHVTGFKNANEYYENRGYSGPEDANDNLDLTWEQYIEDYQDEAEIVIQEIKYIEGLIKNVKIFEEEIEPELKDLLIKLNIPFEINEKIKTCKHMITTINEWKKFTESINLDKSPWNLANKKAEKMFGEFGISTCTEEEINKIIYKNDADKIAEKTFGEFGFNNLSEDQQKNIINNNPSLLR